ncbi:hypothetical protein DJ79_01805 [Halorubrum ezzemoulense]|uniref:DUF7961 domain-containing protein n=1 Tax=Halorubrum ezzemoulense TaxID=337243 RepID=A0A256JN71_HALEZ|nr:hypothetical protein [Halorubrum ezzemoulense]OYR69832.1 hypothetical protein DJ79_01805 [Halorubrum ezzemoulense]
MSDDSGHASRIAGQLAMYDDGENEEAIRRCNSESFSGHDFEVFGYTVDDNVTVAFLGDFEEGVPLRELRSTVRTTTLRATRTAIQS